MTIPAVAPGLVLVTGGSGYIAQFCIAELLKHGWPVRTAVRSLEKEKQVRAGVARIVGELAAIEIVKADLNAGEGWDQAVAGCRLCLACRVAVPDHPTSDEDLLRPARDGTLRVLKAARAAGAGV